jgi:hypothetical protein
MIRHSGLKVLVGILVHLARVLRPYWCSRCRAGVRAWLFGAVLNPPFWGSLIRLPDRDCGVKFVRLDRLETSALLCLVGSVAAWYRCLELVVVRLVLRVVLVWAFLINAALGSGISAASRWVLAW